MSLTFIFLSKQGTEMIAEFLKCNQMILEFRTLWGSFFIYKVLIAIHLVIYDFVLIHTDYKKNSDESGVSQ